MSNGFEDPPRKFNPAPAYEEVDRLPTAEEIRAFVEAHNAYIARNGIFCAGWLDLGEPSV